MCYYSVICHCVCCSGNQSLLALWTSRMNQINNNRHEEFAGRSNGAGNKAQLYKKMDEAFM